MKDNTFGIYIWESTKKVSLVIFGGFVGALFGIEAAHPKTTPLFPLYTGILVFSFFIMVELSVIDYFVIRHLKKEL